MSGLRQGNPRDGDGLPELRRAAGGAAAVGFEAERGAARPLGYPLVPGVLHKHSLGIERAFWFGSLFVAGAVAGAFNPQDASHAGQRAGEVLGGPFLLLSLCASIVLTIYGKLPGTRKPAHGA